MSIEHMTTAGANIFEDLGLKDSENLRLRAQLMLEIRRYVEESGITQAAAAKAMKTTQPRLSEILHGRIDKCTIDRLVQMLAEVGRHVTLAVKVEAT